MSGDTVTAGVCIGVTRLIEKATRQHQKEVETGDKKVNLNDPISARAQLNYNQKKVSAETFSPPQW